MNGYSDKWINKVIQKSCHEPQRWNKELDGSKITLPYIKGTTNILATILNKMDIRASLSPPNSIRIMLDPLKYPRNPKNRKGVYLFAFGKNNIWETFCLIKVRLKEHNADLVYDFHKEFALVKHAHVCYQPKWHLFIQVLTFLMLVHKRTS